MSSKETKWFNLFLFDIQKHPRQFSRRREFGVVFLFTSDVCFHSDAIYVFCRSPLKFSLMFLLLYFNSFACTICRVSSEVRTSRRLYWSYSCLHWESTPPRSATSRQRIFLEETAASSFAFRTRDVCAVI